jgi:hypothetical protein
VSLLRMRLQRIHTGRRRVEATTPRGQSMTPWPVEPLFRECRTRL